MNITTFIELLGSLVLFFAIFQVATDRLNLSVKIYRVQSFFLALSILSIGIYSNYMDLYITAFLTFLIKVIAIPYFLNKVMEKVKIERESKPFINITNSLIITAFIVIFSFFITRKVQIVGEIIAKNIFDISIAIILVGAFIMITRKKALNQIIGFLTIENGIMLAGTSITKGMPLIVEIGIFFDVFVGALMSGILIYQIRGTIESIDTTKLSNLRE